MDEGAISSLIGLIDRLTEKADHLAKDLRETESQLEAARTTLELLKESPPEPPRAVPAASPAARSRPPEVPAGPMQQREVSSTPAAIHGGTQKSALLAYARSAGGLIRARDATQYLEAKGIVSGPNAYQIVYNLLTQTGLFSRVGRGEYQLNAPYHMEERRS